MKRVIVLAEGKSGKTHEFQLQTENRRAQGQEAFFFPLEQLHDNAVEDVLSPSDETKLNLWMSGTTGKPAWFFLDAVDELKLRDGSFQAALRKLHRVVSSKASFTHIFISCRPADWNYQIDLNEVTTIFPLDQKERQQVKHDDPDEVFRKTLTRSDSPAPETEKEEAVRTLERIAILLPLSPEQTM
jgi:hypothetical protein